MTWVDLVVFGFLLLSGLLAFARGLVREVLGIAAWIGAVAAAFLGLPIMQPITSGWFRTDQQEWVKPVSFMIIFLVALVVLSLIARLVGGAVRRSALGGIDRTLGLLFGLARGAVVIIIAYIVGQMVFPIARWPDAVLQARTLTPTYDAAAWVCTWLPPDYRPHTLDAPPRGPQATADQLLHATPEGRATGQPTVRE